MNGIDFGNTLHTGTLNISAITAALATKTLARLALQKNFTAEELVYLANALATSSSLISFKLSSCDLKSRKEGIAVLSALRQHTSLTHLDLRGSELGFEGGQALSVSLKSLPSLKVLDLNSSRIGDLATQEILKSITGLSLTFLDLNYNYMEEGSGHALAKFISTNASLETLIVNYNTIGDEGGEALVNAICAHSGITKLEIAGNMLKKEGYFLAKLVAKNKLIALQMGNPKIDLGGVQQFFRSLKDNTSLQDLRCLQFKVPRHFLEECFESNKTIIKGAFELREQSRFFALNRVSHELKASDLQRRSVPKGLIAEREIATFITELTKSSEEWNALKMVILGHGEIGKTTLVSQIDYIKKPFLQKLKERLIPPRTIGVDHSIMAFGGGEVSVWDFGGQLEYTVTHHFFLSAEMVVYLVCFDLGASTQDQIKQISYWLDFLYSSLPPSASLATNWKVMVVGLRDDLSKSGGTKPDNVAMWKATWPKLPFFDHSFFITSQKSDPTKALINTIEKECTNIFKQHSTKIPTSYKALLKTLQAIPESESIIPFDQLLQQHANGMQREQCYIALRYLHSIGRVVFLEGRSTVPLVCTSPTLVPKIAAQFISPTTVRETLVRGAESVEILDPEQIGMILKIGSTETKLADGLRLMQHVGVCFKLEGDLEAKPAYLFPSLAAKAKSIEFALDDPDSSMQYSGVRFVTTNNIFVPGFFCQFIVALLGKLNIHKSELKEVYCNGVVVVCRALFTGKLIVMIEDDARAIMVLMLSSNTYHSIAVSVLHELIDKSFPQYYGCTETVLCPKCIKACKSFPPAKPLGTLVDNIHDVQVCDTNLHEVRLNFGEPPAESAPRNIHECWSHKQPKHHFFINYRVATEGAKAHALEPQFGIVQVIYERIALQKRRVKGDQTVFVFWDKQCLNYGQDWENAFLYGLTNARVIILVMSEKVFDGIIRNAPARQDNVLVEYECALLQNRLKNVPVIPVLVAAVGKDLDANGELTFSPFDFKAVKSLPNVPHARGANAQRIIDEMSQSLPPHQKEFLGSISQTMAEIIRLQGSRLKKRGQDIAEMEALISVLMATLDG